MAQRKVGPSLEDELVKNQSILNSSMILTTPDEMQISRREHVLLAKNY